MEKIAIPLTGGCLCGHLRYECRSLPITLYLCHCKDCQKRTGSAFSMAMPVRSEDFSVVAGLPSKFERVTEAGNVSWHFYCGDCMIRTHNVRPARTSVTIIRPGTLDDTSWITPAAQIWSSSAQPWACVAEVPTFERDPDDPGALRRAWRYLLSVRYPNSESPKP
jgi:hypothetical protein